MASAEVYAMLDWSFVRLHKVSLESDSIALTKRVKVRGCKAFLHKSTDLGGQETLLMLCLLPEMDG